jgi:3',5'-cyclic AMP phosphodiesterase CpdA
LYEKVLAQNTKLPVHSLLGNHDIWGWGNPQIQDSDFGYGKAMAVDRLALPKRFYSFDAGGWHFVMLDSMTRREKSYFGQLDPEQIEWLRGDLDSAKGKHIAVFSHIPLLAVCVFFDDIGVPIGPEWKVSDGDMHRDSKRILQILAEHRVRLAVSGHIHLVDRVDYRGISFVCDGAVSGNWWKGPREQFPEGYGIFDLHPDGTFIHRYTDYGWKAEPSSFVIPLPIIRERVG